ncbi:MAG: hypothetical protein Q7S16_00400 [bacterium]|nr:hypothetical protein [bacterium]
MIIVTAVAFYILFTHQTTTALRSPWESIPLSFFLLYGAVAFILLYQGVIWRNSPERVRSPSGHGSAASTESEDGSLSAHAGGAKKAKENAPEHSIMQIIPLILLTFLTLSISLLIFSLGSGFDPFIHQATEKIIAATGTITPKPLYYIGQYSLVVFLSKILGVSVTWIDKLLVPLLTSILLPWSIMRWWKSKERFGTVLLSGIADQSGHGSAASAESDGRQAVSRRAGAANVAREDVPKRSIIPTTFLLLPFLLTPFTVTTPYSLALLFLVVLIFSVERLAFSVQLLIATAAILIHPLVGIPACIFLIVHYIQKHPTPAFDKLRQYKTNKNKLLRVSCFMFCTLAIPFAFLLASQFSSQIHITFAPQNFLPWLQSLSWGGIYRENRFNAPLDLLYFYGFNIKNIFWFFILTPLILQIKKWHQRRAGVGLFSRKASQQAEAGMVSSDRGRRTSEAERERNSLAGGIDSVFAGGHPATDRPSFSSFFTTFLILLTSYILMSGFLSFNFLIGYEQADYARRVLDIAQLFLIPFFLLGINWWLARLSFALQNFGGLRFALPILLTLGITASLFLIYPQKIDSYSVSHAFNTSQADIDAVRWIDADAHDEDYIVLANQSVSAAAIHELGFKKYYQLKPTNYSLQTTNSIFFYPIPTGSPLYQYYLDMVYKSPSTETMQNAMQHVSVKRGYFVLNNYWTDFEKIKKEAESNLTLVHSINDSVLIFTLK